MDHALTPTLFVSHGAPTLLIDDCPVRDFLAGFGKQLARPRAVLCISAHWESGRPLLTASPRPETVHDFYGFPEELYRVRYPAPGDPALAARAADLLRGAGMPAGLDDRRGLDHGAWVPLALLFPDAGVPVVQLSLQTGLGPEHQLRVGRALAPLRREGVLILGSGGATHNLREFGGYDLDAPPVPYAAAFDRWLGEAVADGREEEIAAYADRAPSAARNHPTAEHFLPILAPLAARAPGEAGARVHGSFTYGILSMAAFAWGR